jgi:hypothetical protein
MFAFTSSMLVVIQVYVSTENQVLTLNYCCCCQSQQRGESKYSTKQTYWAGPLLVAKKKEPVLCWELDLGPDGRMANFSRRRQSSIPADQRVLLTCNINGKSYLGPNSARPSSFAWLKISGWKYCWLIYVREKYYWLAENKRLKALANSASSRELPGSVYASRAQPPMRPWLAGPMLDVHHFPSVLCEWPMDRAAFFWGFFFH